MPEEIQSVRLGNVAETGRIAWGEGLEVAVSDGLADGLARYRNQAGAIDLPAAGITEELRRQAASAADDLRRCRVFTERMPASSRLPISYQRIPPWIRTLVGRGIGRVKRSQVHRWAAFPKWPLDLSADFAADLAGVNRSPFAAGPTPVLLSHDLDTLEGLRNLIDGFLGLEEEAGARSVNYVVPCGWAIDHGLLEEARRRGNEIGIHGHDHANRTPFSEADERRRRLDAAQPLIERYDIVGYRAPSLLRTENLLRDLVPRYRYDSSIPTSGGLFPVPNNGCASARPFRLSGIWEIPLTLPRDGSLLFLGYSPREMLAVWKKCADLIARSGGIVSLLTHCEERFSGGSEMQSVYRSFLRYLAEDGRFAFQTPRDVVSRLDEFTA